VHYIIEWPAPHARRVPAQHANRLILHGDEAWFPLLPDAFIAHLAAATRYAGTPPARLLLLSGFNIYTRLPVLEQALAHARRWLQTVRRRAPEIWIYLEMAGFTTPTALRRVLREMGPLVDAVGMNEDEFALAADLTHTLREMPFGAQIALMHDILRCYALGRLVVHTEWAVIREYGAFKVQKRANLLASLVGVAAALGGSSRHTWLKLPYCEDFAVVAGASSFPILMLGAHPLRTRLPCSRSSPRAWPRAPTCAAPWLGAMSSIRAMSTRNSSAGRSAASCTGATAGSKLWTSCAQPRRSTGRSWLACGEAVGGSLTSWEQGVADLLGGDELQQRWCALLRVPHRALDGGDDLAGLGHALAIAAERAGHIRVVPADVRTL
jgi:ADP-specific Phosphofructokinase/Glucokinase conserved region